MSDNSTGSSGSSTNSWTLLSPEEADIAGAGDDGTESIGDVPSLSEELAGSCLEMKPSDHEAPPETVLSEEGHQVCQETSPELFDEGAVSGPSVEADPEICAPVIHATITTSPPDNDLLGAVPFSISTESSVFLSQEPFLETSYEESLFNLQPVFDFSPKEYVVAETAPEHVDKDAPVSEPIAEIGPVSEPLHDFPPASQPKAELSPAKEPKAEITPPSEPVTEIGRVSKPVDEIGPASEHKAETTPALEHKAETTPALEHKAETTPALEHKAETTPALEHKAEAFSEHVAEIGHVSKFVEEITPASEPKAEITPASEPKAETTPASEPVNEIRPASEHKAKIVPASEPVVEISPIAGPPDVTLGSESSRTSAVPVSDIDTGVSSCPESSSPSLSSPINFSSAAEGPYPETPASSDLGEKELVSDTEEQKSVFVSREAESLGSDVLIESRGQGSGLRQRRVHYSEELRQSTDEEDEEEFQLPDRKEERPGFAMSYLIIGALALLCLGSLFFSDDFDGSELSDQELLEKLVEENKQISILEKQIQEQRDELDRALRAAAEKPISEEEHARMKEELSALPSLKEELEALKARISELTQLTGNQLSEPSPGPDRRRGRQDELTRQMTLLEQSRTRLEGMKKQNQPKKWLRERLVEMQQRLSEQVDHIGRKDEWRRKHKGGEARKNEMGDGVQKRKELLKKYRYDWEHKKSERKLERETRKQERSWQARPGHKHKHNHKVQQESKDFWKLQEKKLRSNRNPPEHCHDVSSCAEVQGLIRVKLSDFQDLLDVYLNKLQGLTEEHKQAFHHLVAQSFHGGVFSHDRSLFSEFVEDVADILEDLVDVLMDDDELEEEMEEFEREALLKFAA